MRNIRRRLNPRRTIPQSFTITFDQYNALHEIADEQRTNKSALVQEAIDLLLARHIGLHRDGPPAGGLDLGHHGRGGLGIGPVVHADPVAARGTQARRRRADAPAAAGHDQDSAHRGNSLR